MNRGLYIHIIATLIVQLCAEEKPSITIIAHSINDVKENTIKSCLNEIQNVLIESQRFNIVKKAQRDILLSDKIDNPVAEWNFKNSLEVGKYIGLDYVIIIEVDKFNNSYELSLDFIDVKKEKKIIIKRPENHETYLRKHSDMLAVMYEYGNIFIDVAKKINKENNSKYLDDPIYNSKSNIALDYNPKPITLKESPAQSTALIDAFCCFWILYAPYLIILGLLPPV